MRLLSKPLSVSIERPAALVYEVLSVPENFPRWISNWIAEKAEPPASWCFSDRNAFGVLDFALRRPCGASIYVPLRVVANRDGCKLVLTLFRRPDTSDEEYAAAARHAKRDLLAAKALLETHEGPGVELSVESAIEHCRAQLAGYKKPRHVVFVDSLPRNSLGKVLKTELRRNFYNLAAPEEKVPGAKR